MRKQNENKERVNLKSKERLLTQAEKDVIIAGYNRIGTVAFFKFYLVVLLSTLLFGFLVYGAIRFIDGPKRGMISGIICFAGINVLVLMVFLSTSLNLKRFINKMENDELYVTEAIYKGTNRYQTVFLELYKNGKKKQYGLDASLREPISIDDKVILLPKKGQVWIYKARD